MMRRRESSARRLLYSRLNKIRLLRQFYVGQRVSIGGRASLPLIFFLRNRKSSGQNFLLTKHKIAL